MKIYSSREIIKIIKSDGWYLVSHNGTSHQQYKHPVKKGRVTVAHPRQALDPLTAKSILKQAGLI
ncbi:type II toxin-antitoxin system HicA family toxin [Paenibacillus polymyxa]|uniref:type II toxin-antitoxin system HicA family toxin n=1 Tax=Paenibacillus polymyxa TaxID=1406 RepID=UPI000472DBCF|nr:type II toxin-antitoxin system HicA family toxin [Paenibacillus polymyxa]